MLRPLPTLLLIGLLFTACSKEDGVQPCGSGSDDTLQDQGTAKAKDTSGTSTEKPLTNESSAPPNGNTTLTGDDQGISDDGDDLSDSEKSRKKPR